MYDALQGHLEKHEVLNQQELDLKRKLDALKARKDEWQAMTLTLNKKKEDLATKIEQLETERTEIIDILRKAKGERLRRLKERTLAAKSSSSSSCSSNAKS